MSAGVSAVSSEARSPVWAASSSSAWSRRPVQVERSGGVEERVELWLGEERDQRAVVALGREREHSLDQRGLLGVAQRAVAKQGADRGEPQVAGAVRAAVCAGPTADA